MRITLVLDDGLVRSAKELTEVSNTSALVNEGLRALIERSSNTHLVILGGTMPKLKNVPRPRKPRN
jgi:Bacterial antitoxin of type II TA system, VapB